jgi:hypothetical protein
LVVIKFAPFTLMPPAFFENVDWIIVNEHEAPRLARLEM